jgi:hypothetical protein
MSEERNRSITISCDPATLARFDAWMKADPKLESRSAVVREWGRIAEDQAEAKARRGRE